MPLRLKPKQRRALIMDAAMRVAVKKGYVQMRREDIAEEADVSNGLVSKYFNTMVHMRRAVMRHAIRTENYNVIMQGLAIKDPVALKISASLKAKVLEKFDER